jgi:hypothetical protein
VKRRRSPKLRSLPESSLTCAQGGGMTEYVIMPIIIGLITVVQAAK